MFQNSFWEIFQKSKLKNRIKIHNSLSKGIKNRGWISKELVELARADSTT